MRGVHDRITNQNTRTESDGKGTDQVFVPSEEEQQKREAEKKGIPSVGTEYAHHHAGEYKNDIVRPVVSVVYP